MNLFNLNHVLLSPMVGWYIVAALVCFIGLLTLGRAKVEKIDHVYTASERWVKGLSRALQGALILFVGILLFVLVGNLDTKQKAAELARNVAVAKATINLVQVETQTAMVKATYSGFGVRPFLNATFGYGSKDVAKAEKELADARLAVVQAQTGTQ